MKLVKTRCLDPQDARQFPQRQLVQIPYAGWIPVHCNSRYTHPQIVAHQPSSAVQHHAIHAPIIPNNQMVQGTKLCIAHKLDVAWVDTHLFLTGPPIITTYSPGLGASSVSASANIVLTFSEPIQAGSGNIVLTPSSGSAVNVDVADTGQVSFSSAVATVNPTSDLGIEGLTYTVTMGSGVIKDAANVPFAGISGTTYVFTVDTTAPTISTYSPGLGASSVASSANIVLTFSEPIQAGSGNIVLTPPSGSAVNVDVTDTGQVSFSSAVATVNPTSDLSIEGLTYTVTMGSGVIKDAANVPFAGISGSTYVFTTAGTAPGKPVIG